MPRTPGLVSARLVAAATGSFVGRGDELASFDALLASSMPDAVVQWWHGPGGIGKSTLLARLCERAEAAGRRTVMLDASAIEPRPTAFVDALGLDDPRAAADPGVLFVDTAEHLAPLLGWLRERFLPALPATWITVVAGRHPPPASWLVDPAWAALTQVHALGPLNETNSRKLLATRGVPEQGHAAALRFARGNPLALALWSDIAAADDRGVLGFAGSPGLQALVERFTRDAAVPQMVRPLQVLAFSRHTTQAMLADVLGLDDARAVFDALRALSFVRATPHGLVPHDLVRDVLVADAQWRQDESTHRLVRSIYRHHYGRCVAAQRRERIHHQAEALFTQRHVEHKSRFFAWDELGLHRVDPARETDFARLEALVRRHEGEAALPWLVHWWRRQREGFRLFWRDDGDEDRERCDGFLLMLRLRPGLPKADLADPAVAAAWRFIGRHRPLVAGEELVLLRQWMHAERYQAVSAAINLASMHTVGHLITQPGVAWSVVWMADPDFWRPHFDGVNFARCPQADHEIGGRRFGAFVHDWRFEPPPTWIAAEYRPMPFAEEAAGGEPATVTAGDAALVEAVRLALRQATDAAALGHSTLAARLGLDGTALQARLRAAVCSLGAHPRDAKFRDALWHTYIEPMHKQEQVAAELGVPFPTYRYRLHQGIERLAAALAGAR